jgi:Sulfotransferase domain
MLPANQARDGVLRLAMWSGPRNVSTAFMRSWGNREDTIVVDEPFYAHYLDVTGLEHPGRDEVLAHHERNWRRVVDALLSPLPPGKRILYQKQMSHHLLPHMERAWLDQLTHAFLIRDPRPVVASLSDKLDTFDILATGLPQQVEIFEHVVARTGRAPPVLDSADLLQDPERMLRLLCAALDVPFTDRMLWWPPGRRATDGVWAKHWYGRVEQSTGFEPPGSPADLVEQQRELTPRLAAIEAQCRPLYERLRAHRLRA